MLVDEFVYDPGASGRIVVLRRLAGAFIAVVRRLESLVGDSVRVETPVGRIDLTEGTVWSGEIDGGYGVLVLSGSVAIAAPTGLVALRAGEGVTVFDGATPPRAAVWPIISLGNDRRRLATERFPHARDLI